MNGPQKPRFKGVRAIGALAGDASAAAYRKFGFTEQKILTRWPEIAGEVLGRHTQPVKLSFPRGTTAGGTLTLAAQGAAALEVQHLTPMLIERVNRVFGYAAVAKIRIVQTQLERAEAPRRMPEPTAKEIADVAATLPPLEDARLRTALARLGAAINQRQAAARKPGENL